MSIKMNFNCCLFIWWVLYITNECLTEGGNECVQRRLGACKVLSTENEQYSIVSRGFHSPQPESFALKTSLEINLLDNKHSFENNLPVERKRPIGYNLDNAAVVKIRIRMDIGFFDIHLGKKYYRLAELYYYNIETEFSETKYNRYTPSLPTFPYNLNLEITSDGKFSIYADPNTEPFFEYQLLEDFNVENIGVTVPQNQTDLIVFADCSVKKKPNCGSHRVDKLYVCREWFVGPSGTIDNFEGFGKDYGKDVLFDEFIVVQTEYLSEIEFRFEHHQLHIAFKLNSIEAQLKREFFETIKSVRTEQWFEVPASPYAVRVMLLTTGEITFLKISNLRFQEILLLNLCENVGSVRAIFFYGPKLHFDCLQWSGPAGERARKLRGVDPMSFEYHENGYNYTKTLLDITDFVSEPFVIYHHKFGDTTEDWCAGEPKPKVLVTSKYDNDSVQAVIEKSNAAVLTELKEINAKNAGANTAILTELKELADANTANVGANTAVLTSVLTELEKISNTSADANKANADTNAVLLSELKSVKASIDALATHLEQNTTTVNNYYNNLLNVTEFLKILKHN